MRFEVCGGIASGKTTLAQLLVQIGFSPVLEDFQSNPFWTSFYADPFGTAFETEVSFLLQHYHEIKAAANRGGNFVCDFSLLLDLAYARVTLTGGKQSAFISVYDEIRKELSPPRLLVHLVCDARIELDRIQQRGRSVERSITTQYLEAINRSVDDLVRVADSSYRVLSIDSGTVNFADDEHAKQDVLTAIQRELRSCGAEERTLA